MHRECNAVRERGLSRTELKICTPHKEDCAAFYEAMKDALCGRPHKPICVSYMRFFFSILRSEKVLQNNRWRLKRQIRAETIYIEMGFEGRQRGDKVKNGKKKKNEMM